MAPESNEVRQKRAALYSKQQEVVALRHRLYALDDAALQGPLVEAQQQVMAAERELLQAEEAERQADVASQQLPTEETRDAGSAVRTPGYRGGQPATPGERSAMRGLETTGLDVEVKPRMAYVPTGVYHLLEAQENPLVECIVRSGQGGQGGARRARRVRVTVYIEDYSARGVETVEVPVGKVSGPIKLLPTLFPERVSTLYELTRATLNVLAEDLDTQKVEVHRTRALWLLARNAATFEIRDPQTGETQDLRHLLGAYVTPNHPSVQRFLQQVATGRSDGRLAGRLDTASGQAAAIYATLQTQSEITYVNATLAFNPTLGALGQRVRLPHETLAERQANCLDGTLLFASLLEALGLEPAIVLVPNHALVAWCTGPGEAGWRYLETTKLADKQSDFGAACEAGMATAQLYQKLQGESETASGHFFRRLEIGELRSRQVTPLA